MTTIMMKKANLAMQSALASTVQIERAGRVVARYEGTRMILVKVSWHGEMGYMRRRAFTRRTRRTGT